MRNMPLNVPYALSSLGEANRDSNRNPLNDLGAENGRIHALQQILCIPGLPWIEVC